MRKSRTEGKGQERNAANRPTRQKHDSILKPSNSNGFCVAVFSFELRVPAEVESGLRQGDHEQGSLDFLNVPVVDGRFHFAECRQGAQDRELQLMLPRVEIEDTWWSADWLLELEGSFDFV